VRLQAIRQRLLDAEEAREQAALRNKLAAIRLTDGMVLLDGQGQAYLLVKGELDGKADENLLVKFLQNFDPKQKCSWQSVDKNSAWRWDYEPSSLV